jgi:prolyl oligopeptidase
MQLKGSWYRAYATVVPNEDNLFFPKNFLVVPFDDKVSYGVHAILGDNIIITTNNGAPNFRILSASKNELNKLHEFILESNKVIASVNQLGSDKISVKYFSEGKFNVLILDNEGNVLKNFDFPAGTSVGGFSATEDDIYATYYINSFYFPSTGFRLNLSTLDSKPIGVRKIPFNFDDFKTKYISYKSKDGTDVNMYITYNKKIALNGKNPTLINGYGGYGHVITPYFSGQNIIWLSNGGILAVPNIRGGGAQGSEWSEAGRKHNKQNAIDDFIGAAQHLIENNYTNPELLAIEGGSHGGMLVAAAMTQRPDLYKSVISKAAPLDMIRFQNYTIGTATTNLNEFGDINDSIDFEYMYKYSPYHNLNELTKYPNLLLMTGDHDTRVPPFNSYKFLAKLQNLAHPSSTFLVNITESSGHTGPDTKNDALKYKSLKYEFIFKTIGVKYQRLPAYKEH